MTSGKILLALLFAITAQTTVFAQASPAADELSKHFEGLQGCFLLYDMGANAYTVRYNEKQCRKRVTPCSTFKIPHALIGLDLGILKDETTPFKWDGTKQLFDVWNQDHTLQSAIRNSVVWYFQNLASQIGPERMKKYVEMFRYGNQDISGGLTTFWLTSSLQISPEEQVDFLNRLYRNQLEVSQQAMDTVKKILVVDQSDGIILSGKTGSGLQDGKWRTGWFVGRLNTRGREFTFATLIEAEDGATGKKAQEITKKLLAGLGLL